VLDILDEQPVTKDITGCEEVEFNGAATTPQLFPHLLRQALQLLIYRFRFFLKFQ